MKFFKNHKKYLIALFSAAFVFSIAGCAKGDTSSSSSSTSDVSSNSSSSSSSEEIIESSSVFTAELSQSSLNLLPGDEAVLKIKGNTDLTASFDWESDNTSVATVDDNGKVTACREGEANISVSYMGETASCKVTVSAGALQPVAVLEGVSESNVTVSLSDTLNVGAQVSFNGKLFEDAEWSYVLSDESVGTVENGEFKPKKTGTTTLTITGSWRGLGASTLYKTFEITVINATSVVINGGETSSLQLYTVSSHEGESYETSAPFVVSVTENGQVITPSIAVTEGADIASYDAATKTVNALTYGKAEITVSFVDGAGVENSLVVPVTVNRPIAVYENTIEYFSALDGELPIEEIFGAETELVHAYQGEMELRVEDNKVLGALTDRTEVTKTQLSVYDDFVGYLLNVEAYTKVIDEESDFAVFGTKRENVDGYFVLKNDIECAKKWNNLCDFGGTFDGQGFAIKNFTVPHMPSAEQLEPDKWDARRGGFFGSILGGATIKNVAFKDVKLEGYDSSVLAASSQASYYVNSTIENIYISVASINTQGRPGVLFWDRGVWDVIKNVIIDASAFNGVKTFGSTYGPLFASDKWGLYDNGSSWANNNQRISNVFVIAEDGTPMTKDTGYSKHGATIYASNEGMEEDADKKQFVYTGVRRCDDFAALVAMTHKVGDDENYWTVSELGIEWKGELPEVETVVYEKTIKNFSAMDGELPLNEIFGDSDVVITEAYQNGTKLKVENNKVLGVATNNNGMTETQILIFTARVNYILNVEAYTKVLDEESDLAVFDTTNKMVTGYFVLANDIICSGETTWRNDYNTSASNGASRYFNGTLDGKGHKIVGLKVGKFGLLGCMGENANVKNIAFVDTVIGGGDWDNTALLADRSLAASGEASAIENVYISIVDFRDVRGGDRGAGLLYNYNQNIKINNVIMEVKSTSFTETPAYGYGILFEIDRNVGTAANLTNVYVVSALAPLSMHTQVNAAYGIMGNTVAYAGNDRETPGQFDKEVKIYYEGVERYDDLAALSKAVTKVGNWTISASEIVWVEDAE